MSLSCVCFCFMFSEFCSSCLTNLSHALCEWTSVGFLVCMLQWEKPLWLCVTAGASPHLYVTWLWPWSSVSAHPECLDASALALELLHCNWLAFLPRLVLLPCPVFFFSFSKMTPEWKCGYSTPPPHSFLAQTRPCHQHSDSPERSRLFSRAPSISLWRTLSQPISQRETGPRSRPAFIIWIWGQILSREKAIKSPFVWCCFAVNETRLMKCYVWP